MAQREIIINTIIKSHLKTVTMVINGFINTRITIEFFINELIR